jgi:hypothetical protein
MKKKDQKVLAVNPELEKTFQARENPAAFPEMY